MSLPSEQKLSLEAQNVALRAEVQQLRAQQAAAQAHSNDRELRQARFQAVFENSPFGQKIITPDLRIRQANQASCSCWAAPA